MKIKIETAKYADIGKVLEAIADRIEKDRVPFSADFAMRLRRNAALMQGNTCYGKEKQTIGKNDTGDLDILLTGKC